MTSNWNRREERNGRRETGRRTEGASRQAAKNFGDYRTQDDRFPSNRRLVLLARRQIPDRLTLGRDDFALWRLSVRSVFRCFRGLHPFFARMSVRLRFLCRPCDLCSSNSFSFHVPRLPSVRCSAGGTLAAHDRRCRPGQPARALSLVNARRGRRTSRVPDRDHDKEYETCRSQRPHNDGDARDPLSAQTGIASELSQCQTA